MKIGEIMASDREITLNEGKKTVTVMVAIRATVPFRSAPIFISLRSTGASLFDRETAYGYHLDIPSGTSAVLSRARKKRCSSSRWAAENVSSV